MGRTGNQIKELEEAVSKLAELVDNLIRSTQQELTRLEELINYKTSHHIESWHLEPGRVD